MKPYKINLTIQDIQEISQYTESDAITTVLWALEYIKFAMGVLSGKYNYFDLLSFSATPKRTIVYGENPYPQGGFVAKMNVNTLSPSVDYLSNKAMEELEKQKELL